MEKNKIKFTNEKDFTLNAVIPWLRSNGFSDVTYVGGADEFGRDIVCSRKEAAGVKSWVAVQVKDDDIKGNHQSAGIREIINQAKSAIENPFSLPGSRENCAISCVYIVTLGDITANASKIIKNSSELQGRSIHFYDGEKVLSDIRCGSACVSRIKILLRTMLEEDVVKEKAKGLINGLNVSYYSHVPESSDFDYVKFVDVSIETTYKELVTKISEIQQLITALGSLMLAQATLFYSKVYSQQQLSLAVERFLTEWAFKVVEKEECPCLSYNLDGDSDWRWLENVDNLQILQEN